MADGMPWAKLERRMTPDEARASLLGKLLRNEPHLLNEEWMVYKVAGRELRRIYANPRRQIVVMAGESGHPKADRLRRTITHLSDLKVTFDPPLGRVRGDWQIWHSDEVYLKE